MYKLSIIIPVYNAEQYIDDCLHTILPELNPETEVLLIDDGSTDRSLEKCRAYRQENIRILHHDNHGVSYTRNRGVSEAAGEYVMFVDADDTLVSGWADAVLSVAKKCFDIVYFSAKLEQMDKNKKAIADGIFGIRKEGALSTMASPWSKIFSRNFLNNNSITFDGELINGEDALFNLEAVIKAERVEFVDKSIYQYRIHNSSATKKFSPKFYKSNILFLKKAEKLMAESGHFNSGEINYIINFSFSYSVYLYIFLISRIRNRSIKTQEMQKLHSRIMQQYFRRFPKTVHPEKVVQATYSMAQKHRDSSALIFMNCLNAGRDIRNKFRSGHNDFYFIEM